MAGLSDEIVKFLHNQHFIVVSTIGEDGLPHNSCKGLVDIESDGTIYLLDLYKGKTHDNLDKNPAISICAVDEHKFKGYCLKGKAKLIREGQLKSDLVKAWERKLAARITHRLIKNLKGEPGHTNHPEAQFPDPKYLIAITVKEIVDLTPPPLR